MFAQSQGSLYEAIESQGLCKKYCHCSQESHRSSDYTRHKIVGITLVARSLHNKYGTSVFINKNLKVNRISVFKYGTLKVITVGMPGVELHYVYKPPPNR